MPFLGFGGVQPSSAQKIAAAEQELEMITDMFNRLTNSCTKKCIPTDYREGELNKGESVCLDRCVSKFFEVNIKVKSRNARYIPGDIWLKCGETNAGHRSRSRCKAFKNRRVLLAVGSGVSPSRWADDGVEGVSAVLLYHTTRWGQTRRKACMVV